MSGVGGVGGASSEKGKATSETSKGASEQQYHPEPQSCLKQPKPGKWQGQPDAKKENKNEKKKKNGQGIHSELIRHARSMAAAIPEILRSQSRRAKGTRGNERAQPT